MKSNLNKMIASLLSVIMICCMVPFAVLSSAEEPTTTYAVGDIVEYGSYPQSQVTDENLINELNGLITDSDWISYDYNYGYYVGKPSQTQYEALDTYTSDYMKYADICYNGNTYRAVVFSKYRPEYVYYPQNIESSHQDDNGYYINNVYWFKFEPVQWRVLDPDSGILLSEKIIDNQPLHTSYYVDNLSMYHESAGYVAYSVIYKDKNKTVRTYDNSDLKLWLSNIFCTSVFSSLDINNIVDVDLLTKEETLKDTYGFSLSEQNDKSRVAYSTDYANCQGYNDYNYYKWLLKDGSAGSKYSSYNNHILAGLRIELNIKDLNKTKLVKTSTPGKGIISIDKDLVNGKTEYTIRFTDGTYQSLEIANGTDGNDGVGIKSISLNTSGELVVILTDDTSINLGKITGSDGENGANGKDGITPMLKIGEDDYWYVSYDNGNNWESLNTKATGNTGADGQNGSNGIGIVNIEKTNSENNVDTYTITMTDESTYTFTVTNGINGSNGTDGSDGIGIKSVLINESNELVVVLTNDSVINLGVIVGRDGKDGITPKLRVNEETNYWEVSYDDGLTWTSLSVKATGDNGTNGQNGKDGVDGANGADGVGIKSTVIDEKGHLIVTLTNNRVFDLGKITGENGKDGKDGTTISSMYYNSKGELVIVMSDGTNIVPEKPSGNTNNNSNNTSKKPVVKINGYQQTRTVKYGTTITFHYSVDSVSDGCSIHWFINGEDKGASNTITVNNATAGFTVTAKVMKDGSVVSESATEKVNVKNGFFDKISSFFTKLFNKAKLVIDQK